MDLLYGADEVPVPISNRLCDGPNGLPFFIATDPYYAPAFRCYGTGCASRGRCARFVGNDPDQRVAVRLIGVDGECRHFIPAEQVAG